MLGNVLGDRTGSQLGTRLGPGNVLGDFADKRRQCAQRQLVTNWAPGWAPLMCSPISLVNIRAPACARRLHLLTAGLQLGSR